jgi:hypothetical protein
MRCILDIFQEKVHTYRLLQVIFQTLIWEMLSIYVVDMNFSQLKIKKLKHGPFY